MDRVKQALAKARKEREELEKQAPSEKKPVDAHQTTAKAGGESESHSNIEYTSTKKIKLAPEVLRHNFIISDAVNDPAASSYNLLRTRLLQQMRSNNWNTLAITSSVPGEGKTVTAINLALSLAREVNNTVLLVDLDLRRPTIHKYIGYEPEYGIEDYLQNNVPIESILINPDRERLVILPGNKGIAQSSEMLSSPKMKELVKELKTRYQSRLILFDLPPLLAIDDALAFSPLVDSMLVVIENDRTTEDELKRAFDMLDNVNVIGTVLNKSLAAEKQYGYY